MDTKIDDAFSTLPQGGSVGIVVENVHIAALMMERMRQRPRNQWVLLQAGKERIEWKNVNTCADYQLHCFVSENQLLRGKGIQFEWLFIPVQFSHWMVPVMGSATRILYYT
jgi:hypothetical protein